MGLCPSRNNRASFRREKDPMIFLQKLKLLQKEIRVVLKQREEEREAYERETMMFAFKEADWRKEKKQLRDEVRRLRRKLEEREEEVGSKQAEGKREKSEGISISSVESGSVASLLLVEQMREERARRDEAVEKWKMLYLAIKHELDDLIQKTHQGTLSWRGDEEDMREKLQRELKAKDETIQALKAQIASMEEDDLKKTREVDILKQSLRIICSKKGSTNAPTSVVKTLS